MLFVVIEREWEEPKPLFWNLTRKGLMIPILGLPEYTQPVQPADTHHWEYSTRTTRSKGSTLTADQQPNRFILSKEWVLLV